MSQTSAAGGDQLVTREYLDLRLEAEFAKLRSEMVHLRSEMVDGDKGLRVEMVEGFARSQRWLVTVMLSLLVPLLATLVAVLVR